MGTNRKLSKHESNLRHPLSPDIYIDALNDKIHTSLEKHRVAKTKKVKTEQKSDHD